MIVSFIPPILFALAAGGEFLVNRPNLEWAAEMKTRMLRHELDGVLHVSGIQ
jgi:hypothetical protein